MQLRAKDGWVGQRLSISLVGVGPQRHSWSRANHSYNGWMWLTVDYYCCPLYNSMTTSCSVFIHNYNRQNISLCNQNKILQHVNAFFLKYCADTSNQILKPFLKCKRMLGWCAKKYENKVEMVKINYHVKPSPLLFL